VLAVLPLLLLAPHLSVPRLATEPRLDGQLDDPAWTSVTPFTDFVQKEPDGGAAPSEPTRLRIAYDATSVWIAIDCDQQAERIARLTRRDRALDDDRVTIDLDTRGDGRDAFHFEVSAAGVLTDGVRFDDTELSFAWDENWDARVARREGGWSVELRLPLRILRFRPDTRTWGIQVRRRVAARREIDELSPIPRGEAGEVSRYGTLEAPTDVAEPTPLELRPFVVARYGDTPNGPWQTGLSAGGDGKVHLTHDLTLDLTVNPDFGQVEADQATLNLSTFETFFPEKRPFFLEGAELFDPPIQALYTRRIGAAPDAPALPADEQIVAAAGPARILGAAKLTGTPTPGLQLAALAALTGPAEALTRTPDQIVRRRTAAPMTAFAAVRARRGLGERGHLGGFATAVVRGGGDATPATGGGRLCPSGEVIAAGGCFHDAYVGGLDGRWRSPAGSLVVSGDVAGSYRAGGQPELQRDGTALRSGAAGAHAELSVAKEDDGVVFELDADASGRRFDVDDAGYLARANVAHAFASLGWRHSTGTGFVRDQRHQVELFGSTNLRGQWLSGGVQLNTTGTTRGGWEYFTELHWRPAHLDDREVGDGTALERAGRLGWELSVRSDPRSAVSAGWSSSAQRLAGGRYVEAEVDVLAHASSALDLELIPTLLAARGEPRFIDADAGALRFGRQAADAIGVGLRSTYTFSPRATLQVFVQGFHEHVRYADFTHAAPGDRVVRLDELMPAAPPAFDTDERSFALDGNVVLRWEYRLGSFLSLVYTRSQRSVHATQPGGVLPVDPIGWLKAPPDQVFLVKLAGWWGT